jgi:kinesin family protein 2/24
LKQSREDRRKKMSDMRKQKTEREQMNEARGIKVDVDFHVRVENSMRNVNPMAPVSLMNFELILPFSIFLLINQKWVFSSKRDQSSKMNYPMVSDIRDNLSILGEIDCVSCSNPVITVHECKYKVDGITKYIDNQEFNFDNTFSHLESNEELYFYSIRPIIDLVFNQGIVTVFAYG